MASFTPKRAKAIDSEVMRQGKTEVLPWEDIMPVTVVSWLENYAFSIDSTKDILLASILPSVSTLMGETAVRVPSKMFPENINIFAICLCEPGAGKSSAFQHGCQVPLRLHVEQKTTTRHYL